MNSKALITIISFRSKQNQENRRGKIEISDLHSCWWRRQCLWRSYRARLRRLACACPWRLGCSCRRCWAEPVGERWPSRWASMILAGTWSRPSSIFRGALGLGWYFLGAFLLSPSSVLLLCVFFLVSCRKSKAQQKDKRIVSLQLFNNSLIG